MDTPTSGERSGRSEGGPFAFLARNPGIVVGGALAVGIALFALSGGGKKSAGTGARAEGPTIVAQSAPPEPYLTTEDVNNMFAQHDEAIREYVDRHLAYGTTPPRAIPGNP